MKKTISRILNHMTINELNMFYLLHPEEIIEVNDGVAEHIIMELQAS